jgi:hypothetical protein
MGHELKRRTFIVGMVATGVGAIAGARVGRPLRLFAHTSASFSQRPD